MVGKQKKAGAAMLCYSATAGSLRPPGRVRARVRARVPSHALSDQAYPQYLFSIFVL